MEMNETVIYGMMDAIQRQSSTGIWVSVIGVIGSLAIYAIIFMPSMIPILSYWLQTKPLLKKLKSFSGRNIIVMSHSQSGLFGSMITMTDILKIEKLIRKFGGNNIDLIINTFGGDLLASMRLAKLVKDNNISVIVPKYAWSGGTMALLAAPSITMGADATLSPVDPQMGSILKVYSAKYWQEIKKFKGKKADDESIAMSRMGREILGEMSSFIKGLNPKLNKRFYDIFLKGKYTHANQITPDEARRCGLPVEVSKTEQMELSSRIIESLKVDGVFGS